MTLCFNAIFGQQTIGEFPTIDGGFETQIITNIGFITPRATDWTISTSPASTTRAVVTDDNAARSKQQCLL